MTGRFTFTYDPLFERASTRLGVREQVIQIRPVQHGAFNNQQHLNNALVEGMHGAIRRAIERHPAPDQDRFYVSVASDRLRNASNAFFLSAQEWRQDEPRVHALMNNLGRMLNSNEQFEMDDSFTLNVVHVQAPPRGSGRKKYVPGHQSHVTLRQFKRSLIRMPEDDSGLCCARAIITAKKYYKAGTSKREKANWAQEGRLKHRLPYYVNKLLEETGLQPGAWGPEEIKKVMLADSMLKYRLAVVDGRRLLSPVGYGYGNNIIAIFLADGHYDAITKLPAFLGKAFVCHLCLKGYNSVGQHACKHPVAKYKHCHACLQTDSWEHYEAYVAYQDPHVYCPDCNRMFFGPECLAKHRNRATDRSNALFTATAPAKRRAVCAVRKRCKNCRVFLKGIMEINRHACGWSECYSCKERVKIEEHHCFIQKDRPSITPVKPTLYVFFDIEAKQTPQGHQPNLLVCARHDLPTFLYWRGDQCVRQFLLQLEQWANLGRQPITVIAHNFQGYDSYPIIAKLHALTLDLTQIRNGGKVLELKTLDSVRFIDSLSFFQMKLAKFPQTFGLQELKKGYFPHLFNTDEHQEYVGPMPQPHYYMPDAMQPKERKDFFEWYGQNKDKPFDFQKELLAYCQSDVQLLKEGCMIFQKDFMEIAGFCPFEQMTIASACNRYLRRHCLQEDTIAVEPPTGWGGRFVNQSPAAFEWLAWEDHLLRHQTFSALSTQDLDQELIMTIVQPDEPTGWDLPRIRHSHNGGEERLLTNYRYTVDGFDSQTNTAYEFNGCFWHGCPRCFPQRHEMHPRLQNRTMEDVYIIHQEKVRRLEQAQYNVRTMWECEWAALKKDDANVKAFLKNYRYPQPLNPRDAFYGGRTNAYKLYHQCTDDEVICYYDFKSLYPFVNKYCMYPVGHPLIISQPPVANGLAHFFGLARVTILPPQDLYHPVLPYRCRDKLTFPLCATCVENLIDEPLTSKMNNPCVHNVDQRALTGTWCTPELMLALRKGYTLLYIHQVYHFSEKRVGLFKDYVDTWLQLKEEASGYPEHCTTAAEQRAYIRRYMETEGVVLSHRNMVHNPGKRTMAKLMLNSMWGKFGQQTNKTQVKEFTETDKFWQFLDSSKNDIRWVSPLDEERVEVHHRMQTHCQKDSPILNIFMACFTTCHARLRLYQALDNLGERCLYTDTDSVIFVRSLQDPPLDPPPGDNLGDFTNELKDHPGDTIVEFCSGGPKNYGYRTQQGVVECKVRGFSLNVEGQAQLNFEVLKNNTLQEINHPLAEPRVTPVVQSHTIQRAPKTYELTTAEKTKNYQLVYNKRLLDKNTFKTYPYGYVHSPARNSANPCHVQ